MKPEPVPQPWWSRAISALSLLVLAYLLGFWLSKWFAPKPLSAPAASLAPALALSGSASKQAAESLGLLFKTPSEQVVEAAPTAVRLHGTMVAGASSTIIASLPNEKPRVYRIGESIGTLRVQSVQQEAAILQQADGKTLRIELPKRDSLLSNP